MSILKKIEILIVEQGKKLRAISWLSLPGIVLLLAGTAPMIDYQLYNSSWPNEHYDGRGSNASPGKGLDNPSRLLATSSTAYSEGFAFLTRDPSELYLMGGMVSVPNYIAKMNPKSLVQSKRTSLDCPSTDCPFNYTWSPSGAVHVNGYLYVVAESRVWKLDKDLNVLAFYNLPLKDGTYNSLKILSDGNIVVKGLGIAGGTEENRSTLTVLTPDLQAVIADYKLPEKAAGRISVLIRNNIQYVYVTGVTTLMRFIYTPGNNPTLKRDATWSYQYRNANDPKTSGGGIAQFIDNEAYFMDNAQASPTLGPIHLIRVNLDNSADAQKITPFPGTTLGYNINKQVVDSINKVIVVSDSTNGQLAGFRYLGNKNFTQLWQQPFRSQVIGAAASGSKQLYMDDWNAAGEFVIILDILTGKVLNRIPTGAKEGSNAALSIGYNNDIFFNSGKSGTSLSMRIYKP
jgi:hypothetical protein